MDKDFLLQAYGAAYGPEAGPWNLGVENKYLEYKITAFFEENFPEMPQAAVCNVGIGAGAWDRYLSYRVNGGTLTSVDRDPVCCRQLQEGLAWEGNPNAVEVLCADVMTLPQKECFDLVTVIGSTHQESGLQETFLEKVMSLVKPGGSLYYQVLEEQRSEQELAETGKRGAMRLEKYEREEKYGFSCQYCKFVRE